MLNKALDTLLSPLLSLPPLVSILLLSLILSFLIIIVYKLATNQEEMKNIKQEMKDLQKQLKQSRKDISKAQKIQKQLMSLNAKYMRHSFKSMIYTFLPLILIFSWMSHHYTYENIYPNQNFQMIITAKANDLAKDVKVTSTPELEVLNKTVSENKVLLTLKAQNIGNYDLIIDLNGNKKTKPILISNKQEYETPVQRFKDSDIESVMIAQERLHPFGGFNLLGWHPGWLGIYIISSILFNSLLRKLLKVY